MRAILAGADSVIIRSGGEKQVIPYICERIAQGGPESIELSARIRESGERILRTKKKYDVVPFRATPPLKQPVSTPAHRQVVQEIMDQSDAIYGQDPAKKDSYPEVAPSSQGLKDLVGP